jgi:hypothetical protein
MKRIGGSFVVVCIVLTLQGCRSAKIERTNDLVVVEQTDTVYGTIDGWAAFTVDVPVNGPLALVNSVKGLINRELYDACENCIHFKDDVVIFNKGEVFTHNRELLLSHFMEIYKPIIQDSLFNTYGLELKLEAQTDKYVTYGVEHFHCGASCGSEKSFYTFDKQNGHQVQEIISHESLVRFFEDYPEYANKEGYLWKFSPESDFDNSCYGLLDDHFTFVIIGWYNHYFSVDVPYSQIFSYLSPETQALVGQKCDGKLKIPPYLSERSEDHQVWMEIDTISNSILGYLNAAGGPLVTTLKNYDSALEAYPKRVHSIDASEGSDVFLFIYSFGNLLCYDEAMTCILDEDGLKPANLFTVGGKRESVVKYMMCDQQLGVSEGFPFDTYDENRFGLHYDPFSKCLYSPVLESSDPDSEFVNTSCLRYTGRFKVFQFNGQEFILVGDDGAWWLNPDLRNYKRTISNRISANGIEQIDLMPDGTYRRAVWEGAKTLDDLRKKPDEVKISADKDF